MESSIWIEQNNKPDKSVGFILRFKTLSLGILDI